MEQSVRDARFPKRLVARIGFKSSQFVASFSGPRFVAMTPQKSQNSSVLLPNIFDIFGFWKKNLNICLYLPSLNGSLSGKEKGLQSYYEISLFCKKLSPAGPKNFQHFENSDLTKKSWNFLEISRILMKSSQFVASFWACSQSKILEARANEK